MSRRIVITGAGRGIGHALVQRLAADGHEIIGTARSADGRAATMAAGAVAAFELDLAHEASIEACAAAVSAQYDSIDTLINNAGMNSGALGVDKSNQGPFQTTKRVVLAQIEANAVGPMVLTQRLQPLLAAGSNPVVLNMSSQLGSMVVGGRNVTDVGYNASKSVMNMVTAMSATADPTVAYVAMHPGWVQTDMGGATAAITIDESVEGLVSVLGGLTIEDSGRFLTWEGRDHPW